MQWTAAMLAALALVACGRVGRAEAADPPEALVFDGFGLGGFHGAGSVAAALRGIDAEASPSAPLGVPLDVKVKGPSGRSSGTDPLAAEVKGRIEGVDLSAGLHADPTLLHEGPAKWVGGACVSSDHGLGREALELKTSLGRNQQAGVLGFEMGPRIERRMRGGMLFFLDGKAQAQVRRPAEGGAWMLPGLAQQGQGDAGMLGVTANTGVVR